MPFCPLCGLGRVYTDVHGDMVCDYCDEVLTEEEKEGFDVNDIPFEDDYDGQPDEYTEWEDVYGGDDWDHGQYDEY